MPVVPATHTFVAAVATTSEANTYIRDPLLFALNPPRAELIQVTGQALATGTGAAINFNAEILDYDPDGIGGHDNTTNPSRYTARYAGWYQVSGAVAFVANATGRRGCWWVVNAANSNGSQTIVPATAASGCQIAARTKMLFLNVGDYVQLFGFQESGGSLDTDVSFGVLQSTMSIRWVSN